MSIGDIGCGGAAKPNNYTGNTHGSLVQIGDAWYIFYHRQTNGHPYSRQACAERVEIRPDGSIPQAETTSCGLNGGPLAGKGSYPARIACNLVGPQGACESRFDKQDTEHPYFTQSGADREADGDQYIANMRGGAWAAFKYFDFSDTAQISVRVRGTANGVLEVRTEAGGSPAACIKVAPVSGWAEYTADVRMPRGRQALYFTYRGDGALDFDAFTIS